jgi:hypothetical protein
MKDTGKPRQTKRSGVENIRLCMEAFKNVALLINNMNDWTYEG